MNESINPLRSEYEEHIKKQKLSGLSIKKYCEENNLVQHKLSYYRSNPLKSKKPLNKNSFASVKVKPSIALDKSNKIDPIWLGQFINSLLGLK